MQYICRCMYKHKHDNRGCCSCHCVAAGLIVPVAPHEHRIFQCIDMVWLEWMYIAR